jgi:hypothetical protein
MLSVSIMHLQSILSNSNNESLLKDWYINLLNIIHYW